MLLEHVSAQEVHADQHPVIHEMLAESDERPTVISPEMEVYLAGRDVSTMRTSEQADALNGQG